VICEAYLVAEAAAASASFFMFFSVIFLQAHASMFFTTHFLRLPLLLFPVYIAKSTHHFEQMDMSTVHEVAAEVNETVLEVRK